MERSPGPNFPLAVNIPVVNARVRSHADDTAWYKLGCLCWFQIGEIVIYTLEITGKAFDFRILDMSVGVKEQQSSRSNALVFEEESADVSSKELAEFL